MEQLRQQNAQSKKPKPNFGGREHPFRPGKENEEQFNTYKR